MKVKCPAHPPANNKGYYGYQIYRVRVFICNKITSLYGKATPYVVYFFSSTQTHPIYTVKLQTRLINLSGNAVNGVVLFIISEWRNGPTRSTRSLRLHGRSFIIHLFITQLLSSRKVRIYVHNFRWPLQFMSIECKVMILPSSITYPVKFLNVLACLSSPPSLPTSVLAFMIPEKDNNFSQLSPLISATSSSIPGHPINISSFH